MCESRDDKVSDAVSRASSNYIIIWFILLQHEPHGLNVVPRETPITLRIKVAQYQLILQALLDARYAV